MVKNNRGAIFVVSAPSGAGKTSLCQEVTKIIEGVKHSISYTTRSPRQGEANDVDYTFIKEEEFSRMVSEGEFVEWAVVHGNFYGTSMKRLDAIRDEGFDVILDIDTQGAIQLKSRFKDGVYIFILPPSMEVLEDRLRKRMSDSEEEIRRRLKRAREEIKEFDRYDYLIVNDRFDVALKELGAIIISERLRTENMDAVWIREKFSIQEGKNGYNITAGRI